MRPALKDIDFAAYPPMERIAFAHQLLGDAMAELRGDMFTREQIASFQADIDAYHAGEISAEPWEDVYARLKQDKK